METLEGEAATTGDYWRRDYCYAGTLVTQGTAAVRVEATGSATSTAGWINVAAARRSRRLCNGRREAL